MLPRGKSPAELGFTREGRVVGTKPIVHSLAGLFLAIAVLAAAGVARSPDDLFQAGPDPIAPELSATEADSRAAEHKTQPEDGGTVGQTANGKNGKNDLDLLELNIEELSKIPVRSASPAMEMQVSTVARTESTVGRSPAAVYVITNEMIRRSGARNLPEVLRLAPGVNVARCAGGIWAISIRGFNDRYANKLLVQIDGRAVYTPAFGGVFWDMQQVLLEDVERIEVVRGPGGTVWGANAVNGVINIVTKDAAGTRGIYAESGGGNEHRSFNSVRAGGRAGDLDWRVYGIQADNGPGYTTLPIGAWDSFQYGQGGFRLDWTPNCRDTLTLQGDFYGGQDTLAETDFSGTLFFFRPKHIRTSNFLGRWTRTLDDDTDWSVQMNYDNWRQLIGGTVDRELQNQSTFDLDSQYHTRLGRHEIVCGFGYRNYDIALLSLNPVRQFVPPTESYGIISYFVQDTIELRPDRLFLTAGVKLEHNNFTNFEYQPSVRLLATPNDRTALWGAVSRAVRTPSVSERDAVLYEGLIVGNKNLRSEDLLAYELGIRRQPTDRLYWDLAAFFNRYESLIGLDVAIPPSAVMSNVGRGDTYGYELVVTYEVNPTWQLRGAYSFLVEKLSYGPNGAPFVCDPGLNPRNQFFIHSAWNLSPTTTLDVIGRYVDNLAVGVPHYFVMDVRLARQFGAGLEMALVGQNLLENHHLEFVDVSGPDTQVQSGVYGMVSWRY